MKKVLLLMGLLLFSTSSNATDITWADKTSGGQFTATDANAIKAAVNTKADKTAALVGDCTVGPCLDGTSDGGNLIRLWAGTGSYWTTLQSGTPAANRSWKLPVLAPPSAGETNVMTIDENGQMSFLDKPGTTGYVLSSTDAGVLSWTAPATGYTNLTSFLTQTTWKLFYSDGAGDVKELALGADGEYLKSNGAASIPSWATPTGAVHDAITISTDLSNNLLGLSTQQLTLDSQTANYIFAAPNSTAGVPSFRAMVDGDIPSTIARDTELPTDATITTTDVATSNASTSKHGWAPKATAPAAGLYNYLGITNGETVYTNKALFDAAVPATQAFSDTAAAGSAAVAARRDHKHAMPAAPTTVTGNAGTATTLQTARDIGGVSFNGSASINLPGVNTAGTQNTSGTAAGLTAQYIDWNAASGGNSIANKPTLPSYPGAGIPVSTGAAWGTSYSTTTLAAALDGEAWTFSGAVDLSGATSVLMGPISFEGATADAYQTVFSVIDPTVDRTITVGNYDSKIPAATAVDASGNTVLAQGAAPAVDAAGKIAVDTTSDQLKYYGGAERVLSYKDQINFNLKTPVDADDYFLFKAQTSITITDIHVITIGGTSISVDIQECTSTGTSCVTVDAAITADTDGAEDDGALSNGAIDAGDWVKVVLGAPSGTVNYLTGSIYYVETAN